MAKVLLTGGAGFIGSYVARELLAKGHEVVVYDSFIQYVSPLKSMYQAYLKERFRGIDDKVIIERGDTRDAGNIARLISHHKPERVIHLAALPIADLSNTNPEEALSTILVGTVNVLEAIRNSDCVKRFVYTSSSMVYGDFVREPVSEDDPKKPKEVYGGTKLAGEILTESYGRRFGVNYTIVRPSAVYGPTDVNRRVTEIFLRNAMEGKELVLHGGGGAKLDFTYVEDLAQGFVLATFAEKANNQVFNITRGEGRGLSELADALKKHFPDLKIREEKSNVFRPKRGALDISKARELLGYEPKYSLEAGMDKYVEFVKREGDL